MAQAVYYLAGEAVPNIRVDQIAVELAAGDYMLFDMLRKILRKLNNG